MRPADDFDCSALRSSFRPRSGVEFTFLRIGQDITILLDVDAPIKIKLLVGGKGISERTIDCIKYVLPGIDERLRSEEGKIGILGNGLSSLAVDLATRYKLGMLREKPVIIDLFDYHALYADLCRLEQKFREYDLWFPKQDELKTMRDITRSIEEGNLRALQYCMGSGSPPFEAQNCNLLINCHGPPLRTFSEQVSLLAPQGELYVNLQFYNHEPFLESSDGLVVRDNTPKTNIGGFRSYVVRRLSVHGYREERS